MHIHFLGIAGTFMSSLAILAKQLGLKVTGQDEGIYPPMSEQLTEAKVDFFEGYKVEDLPVGMDLIIIGNVMKRGMPIIEYILNHDLNFISGPEFLAKFVLPRKHVLVVSGTHGKTTTTSMLAWILDTCGLAPGYLIGGMPKNFTFSATIGKGKFFVIEGDEYDCAFFDKRSKFVHYHPKTVIINNIEFDHADIFINLSNIITHFHHLVRLVPSNGNIIFNQRDRNVKKLLAMGSWSNLQGFDVKSKLNLNKNLIEDLEQNLPAKIAGKHNLNNAMAACLAAASIGIDLKSAVKSLSNFDGVARRLEHKGCYRGVNIYDDFAHHPTAIYETINALCNLLKVDQNQKNSIISVIDLGSNTLKMGINNNHLLKAVQKSDVVYLFANIKGITWSVADLFQLMGKPGKVCMDIEDLMNTLYKKLIPGDNVLFMSNGALAAAVTKLINMLKT